MIRSLPLCCLLLAGCGPGARQDAVRPARVAVSDAADALSRAQEIELLRIRLAVLARAKACTEQNTACVDTSLTLGYADEATNIARIETLTEAQQLFAEAIQAFDNCAPNGGNVEACEARAVIALTAMLPKVKALTDALRRAVK